MDTNDMMSESRFFLLNLKYYNIGQ